MAPQRERRLQPSAMGDRGSPPQDQDQVISSETGPAPLQFLTLNINAWQPFRDRWSEEGTPKEIQSATLIFLQEHRLTTVEQCQDATEWCAARGWDAVFGRATQLASGKPSGGVAILIAHRPDVGVTDPQLNTEGMEHRLLALRLVAPGLTPTIVAAVYLQAGGGLNQTNRSLLATLAQWQESAQLPILAGGDFNLRPEQIQPTDFLTRSGLQLLVPRGPTYFFFCLAMAVLVPLGTPRRGETQCGETSSPGPGQRPLPPPRQARPDGDKEEPQPGAW